ncbi:MAG TPA: acyltransferase [Ancylobacter sp.]
MSGIDARLNNFGLLRLLFASSVVLSHAPELVDGNRSRELLTRIFGTLSFGELGVDGFFLISGYLITRSFLTSPGLLAYLTKRVARIYPAFLVATIVSIAVFAPLSGTDLSALLPRDWVRVLRDAVLLQPPPVPAFAGVHYPILNGAMWTIAYEFRCYLLVACLGLLGILQRRLYVLAGTIILVLLLTAKPPTPYNPSILMLGNVPDTIRMTAAFFVGSIFYLYRDVIVYRTDHAVLAAIALVACMFVPRVAEPALYIFGGYLIFWLALVVKASPLSGITTEHDISYGLYLYTWPIQSTLVFFYKDISPWLMFAVSLGLAALFGLVSWAFLERKILRLVHRRPNSDPGVVPVRAQAQTGA